MLPDSARIDRQQHAGQAATSADDDVADGERSLHLLGGRKQPFRPHHQHDRHQQVDQHRGQRRRRGRGGGGAQNRAQQIGQEGAAERVDHADEDRGHERAADRADAADDDDDEGEDQDVLAHADLHGEDRRLHQPGKAGERRAEAEHQRVEQLDVDAERADHFAVRGAGADQHADARAHHHDIEQRPRPRARPR